MNFMVFTTIFLSAGLISFEPLIVVAAPADVTDVSAQLSVNAPIFGGSIQEKIKLKDGGDIDNNEYSSDIRISSSCADAYDCDSCLGSNSECTWFEGDGYSFCGRGCGMFGCGASICAVNITTCEDCLGGSGTPASGQYSWSPMSGTSGECIANCMDAPADAPCYKASDDPSIGYDPSICPSIEPEVVSSCSDAQDCASCLGRNAFCTWFQDIGYCEEGCGMNGCGATICAADIKTCYECLGGSGTKASGQYSWSPMSGVAGECLTNCQDAPADAPCYSASEDPTIGYNPSICPSISICQEKTTCMECLEGNACAWSTGECFDSCRDAPADASCFAGSRYGYSREKVCYAEVQIA